MTRIVVCGALGRMGRRIIDLALERDDVEVAGGVEHPDCVKDRDLGGATGDKRLLGVPLTDRLEDLLPSCDVVIEFSGDPVACVGHARLASAGGKGVVIGTTGLKEDEIEELKALSKNAPVLYSPNMSLGVNLLFKLTQIASKVLGDKGFDMEVVEIHHRFKKDAPSGTAVRLAQILTDEGSKKSVVYGREGISPRSEDEVGVFALRGGDVVGEHTVFFIGMGERLELTHRAGTRDIFARGALEASVWIKDREPGFYTMLDLLDL